MQTDKDLAKIRKRIVSGELFEFKREENSLIELMGELYDFLIEKAVDEDLQTVRERIDWLVSLGKLPQYMINRYKGK